MAKAVSEEKNLLSKSWNRVIVEIHFTLQFAVLVTFYGEGERRSKSL